MPKGKAKPKATRKSASYTDAEIVAMIRACSPNYPTGIRNRAMIAVGYGAGLRISEVLALTPSDINYGRGEIFVAHGKGARKRTVNINEGPLRYIKEWANRRRSLGITRGPLFCTITFRGKGDAKYQTKPGGPLSSAYIRQLMPRIASKAGVEDRGHFHGLRHTHALAMNRNGASVELIKRQLGHTSLETTSRYLQGLNSDDAKEAVADALTALESDCGG